MEECHASLESQYDAYVLHVTVCNRSEIRFRSTTSIKVDDDIATYCRCVSGGRGRTDEAGGRREQGIGRRS